MHNELARLQGLPLQISQLAHAYVLEGVDLSLRRDLASALSRLLLCRTQPSVTQGACGQCQSCQLFSAQTHPDFLALGQDGAIGIDEVRKASRFLEKTAQLSGNQVVMLEQVEDMSENAANALLKTLEEPTRGSYLLLLTRDKNSLMATIRSRCQFLAAKNKSRNELKLAYGNLPDYLLGFSNNSEGLLKQWAAEGKLEHFEAGYQTFIQWLKCRTADSNLTGYCAESDESMYFMLYLFERRIRQLLLKGQSDAVIALNEFQSFKLTLAKVKGQNRALAITALVQELAKRVR